MFSTNNELYHYGIKGMRLGIRRFQKEDGTLTNAGKKRYNDGSDGKYVKGLAMVNAPELAKLGALYVAAPMMAGRTINHIRAEKYRDEHPNTDLTDKEIIKMLNEQTSGSD